jgi:hypothetical protein
MHAARHIRDGVHRRGRTPFAAALKGRGFQSLAKTPIKSTMAFTAQCDYATRKKPSRAKTQRSKPAQTFANAYRTTDKTLIRIVFT